jgi:phage pi2 protein 07
MDKIIISASITLENGFATQKYKWKSENRTSSYRRPCKRAVIRFTCKNFADKISNLDRANRQILINFIDEKNILIKRIKSNGISIQGYSGNHPYIQIVINSILPKTLWGRLDKTNKKSLTFPMNVELNLTEWKDISISPSDFILQVEKESKSLMNHALQKSFKIVSISKGRQYDLSLINPNGKEFIIAISSHVAKTKSRSKEKTIQKILIDISKMLPSLYENKKAIPVVITQPIEFENSWSFTTKRYLDFYKNKFGFRFLTTEFKNGWEDDIIMKLSKM